MAEPMISAFVRVLVEKLVSETSNSIARYKGIGAEIEKCQDSLKLIQVVLADAYQKEITSQAVKLWLNDLLHLAYDIDDILDGWATDAMSRESEAFTSKVRKMIPTCCTNFSPTIKMHGKLDRINAKLERLVKQRDDFGLRVEGETKPKNNNNRRLQTSIVDPSSIIGREAEKEALVIQLLEDGPCDQKFSIVPIIGMGGVGKTTLARLLYNEKQVKDHFQVKAWVCVSDEFDSFAISKEIFEAVGGEVNKFTTFNKLQEALRDLLKGKRFLLVLDDVWSESREDWETLVRPFYTCSPGSKIIITTRKVNLLKKLGYNHLNKQLKKLSYDDALSLFALHALGVRNFESHLSLKPHGEGIVEKCDRLPLALIAVGTSLRTKEDEDSWKGVLESEIWKLPVQGEIIPALRLSYHDLSAPLKQLFAYCSLFPKDFLFDKEGLVLLWMAEGFLHQPTPSDSTTPNDSTGELLGHEFFDELLSRSFFQVAPDKESLYVMHDLMNDLATFVAGEFFVRLESEAKKDNSVEMLKYRHMSFVREEFVSYEKFKGFTKAKKLRTFMSTSVGEEESWGTFYLSNKILTDLLPDLLLLRILSLKGFQISEVPESIGTLRHLRYLNLSRTRIPHLPETICNLYNLQTLILSGCDKLTELPNNFLKLKNLRHLDVKDTPLLFHTLVGIGELKSLQITLSDVIIKSESGFELAKLKDFKNLSGNISIRGLEQVQNAIHAHEANFSQKRISVLELVWHDWRYDSRNEMLEKEILNELKPCQEKLIQLNVKSYGGLEFPNWVGDPSFLHLKHVSISGCKRCTCLPPLAQLPSLKELFIKGLYAVEAVDFKSSGAGCGFLSLEILSFIDMIGWKKWSGAVFPRLQKLTISGCPNLVELSLEALPSLNDLTITKCNSHVLRRMVEVASTVTKMEISDIASLNDCPNLVEVTLEALPSLNDLTITKCNSHVLRRMVEVASAVTKLKISDIASLNDCPNLVEVTFEALPSLNDLTITKCDSVVLRKLVEIASAVTKLEIRDISGLNDVVWRGVIEYLGTVEELHIVECNEIRYVVKSDAAASKILVKLRILVVYECNNLVSIGEKEEEDDNFRSNLLPSLRSLNIFYCGRMKRCSCPDGIEELIVESCRSMTVVSFPKGGQEKLRSVTITKCNELLEREFGGQKMNNNNNRSNMSMLEFVWIRDWPNLKSIIALNSLVHLTELKIYDCEGLESFPDNLISLKKLEIKNCPRLDDFFLSDNMSSLDYLKIINCPRLDASLPGWVWPPNLRGLKIGKLKKPFAEWGPRNFPTSLVFLVLCGGGEEGVGGCSEFSRIPPSSLTSLTLLLVNGFEKMESVSMGLQHLTSLQLLAFKDCRNLKKVSLHPQQHSTSLQHLCFMGCPKMKDLPELLLPSLLGLEIGYDCPGLEERCRKNGTYWPLISHIPYIEYSTHE